MLLIALCAAISAPSPSAAQLIVVEARGIGLRPGVAVDETAPLILREGQHVVLIAPNGATLKIDGPNSDPPKLVENGNVLQLALNALVTQSGARTAEAGVTRAGEAVLTLPDPWLLDVSRTGHVCLLQGQQPVFWRASAAHAAEISVWPSDRSWKAHATWPAEADKLDIPPSMPVHGGATYLVSFDGNAVAAVTVHLVPAGLANDSMRVAWMAHQRCEAQAEALLRKSG